MVQIMPLLANKTDLASLLSCILFHVSICALIQAQIKNRNQCDEPGQSSPSAISRKVPSWTVLLWCDLDALCFAQEAHISLNGKCTNIIMRIHPHNVESLDIRLVLEATLVLLGSNISSLFQTTCPGRSMNDRCASLCPPWSRVKISAMKF